MRGLCALQIALAIHVGWFYMSRIAIDTYPGAYSVSRDGPFRTKEDCEQHKSLYFDLAKQFGIKVDVSSCVEQGDA